MLNLHQLVSELWLIQMAQRVSDYRVRRFADRGNEEDGPDSRARGDRFYRNRRSADRGNEKVNRDPGNIYNFPPVYDEYEDEDWYYWMTGAGAGVTYDPNTLPVIYDRGLLGVMHDWCEPFDTYPRTYDLSHAAGLFLVEKKRCNLLSIMLEMDRILRPGGHVYIRDSILVIDELQEIGRITGLILLVENGDRVVNDYVFDPGGSFFEVIKTRGRVFFEEGENDADKDMKNSKFSHIR